MRGAGYGAVTNDAHCLSLLPKGCAASILMTHKIAGEIARN